MKNKYLLLILVVLLAIFGVSKLLNKPVNKSFKEELVNADSTEVSKIVITNFKDPTGELTLEKSDDIWVVKTAGKSATATTNTIQSVLSQALHIKANRLVAIGKDKWVQYEVDEQSGTKVQLFDGEKLLSSFISGRLNFNQQQRSATSYIRLDGENETYAVDGFLSMAFKQGFDSFRDKRLITLNKDDVNRIVLSGDQVIEIRKNGASWMDQIGTTIDSADMSAYLNAISNLYGVKFNDDFDEKESPTYYTLTIEANNQLKPIIIQTWQIDENAYILTSSLNEEAKFESDGEGIFKKAILDLIGLSKGN